MSNADKQVNVEEIVEEIKREIKERGLTNDDIAFSDIPVRVIAEIRTHSDSFIDNIHNLSTHYKVAAYRPLKSNRLLGFMIIFIKKAVRKLTKFYIEPIVDDQNEVNRLTVTCIHDLHYDLEIMRRQIKVLEYDINQLKEKMLTDI